MESLNEDRKKKAAKEEKQEEEEAAADLEKALSMSAETAKVEYEDRQAYIRSRALSQLSDEPVEMGEGVISVCFRLPQTASKGRLVRKFRSKSDTSGTLLNYLRSRIELGEIEWELSLNSKCCIGKSGADANFREVPLSELDLGSRVMLWVRDTNS